MPVESLHQVVEDLSAMMGAGEGQEKNAGWGNPGECAAKVTLQTRWRVGCECGKNTHG
jgi:hypothetical protein